MRAVHIIPEGDWVAHEISDDCVCGPQLEYFDPETEEPHEMPIVVHESLDGREEE